MSASRWALCGLLVVIIAGGLLWATRRDRNSREQQLPKLPLPAAVGGEGRLSGVGITGARKEALTSELLSESEGRIESRNEPQKTAGSPLGQESKELSLAGDQKFILSTTIKEGCLAQRWKVWCTTLEIMLHGMSDEPRREPWASSTESELYAFPKQSEPASLVRSLECRSTVCAVELVSPSLPFELSVTAEDYGHGLSSWRIWKI
jgi:hypothetical protein